MATVLAERNSNSPPAQSRKTLAVILNEHQNDRMRIQNFPCCLLISAILFGLLTSSCNSLDKRFELQKKSLTDHIGDTFRIQNILDSTNNQIQLDFSKSDLTIIDFWFNDCPPCIKEMNQFSKVLSGKEGKISIVSISLNQFWVWKPTLTSHTGRFAFLNNNLSNWTQYVLQTSQDEKLKNEISADRLQELEKLYNITFFPAFFVVNKKGIILERPVSAVEFIKKQN